MVPLKGANKYWVEITRDNDIEYCFPSFYTLLKPIKSTLILISSLVLPPLVTYYSLIFKLYKLFVERNKTVCPGPISFLQEAVIFLSLSTRHAL